jgi:polyferredoxin
MNFLANTIDITKYEEKNIIFALFVVFCIKITIAGVTSILSLFWTYESLFNINIEQKIKEQKEKKRFIKKNKLQWWRLRNMHILVRFLIYLLVSYITIIYIKIIAFASFIENSTGINLFANNFELLMKYTTVSLILIVLITEFLVRKNIKKRLVK